MSRRARRRAAGCRPTARSWAWRGMRSLPPPPPPSSSSGGDHVGASSERRNITNSTRAERQRDEMQRAEDHHQLLVGRHCAEITRRGERVRRRFATMRRCRSWPLPRHSTSRLDRSPPAPPRARAPPAACAARAWCPASSTAAATSPQPSPSTRASCATRSPTPARSSTIASTAARRAPVLVKDLQRHPVRGEAMHVDLLRVDMNETIHTTVVLELHRRRRGARRRRGRRALSQETRELNIEALPGRHPGLDRPRRLRPGDERDAHAVGASPSPAGVTLLDDLEETVIATITPPTLEPVEEEIETETELVGEDGEPLEGEAAEGEAGRGRRPTRPSPPTSPEALLAPPRSTGWSSGSATPGPATPTRRTTSASRSPTSWPSAGTCRSRRRSSPAS